MKYRRSKQTELPQESRGRGLSQQKQSRRTAMVYAGLDAASLKTVICEAEEMNNTA